MRGAKTLICGLGVAGALWAQMPEFDGAAALEATKRMVAFGPRPAGSAALAKTRQWIESEMRKLKCQVVEDTFTAKTPKGARSMTNVIAKFPGSSGRVAVVSGHYDTYDRPGLRFVGANDGGSSAGLLLQLARSVARMPHRDSVWIVWLDGEESIVEWRDEDHTYGSRHLAKKWKADGTLDTVLALINVDMTGDADLSLIYEMYSTAWLRELVWSVAARLGYGREFSRRWPSEIADDHAPFVDAGVAALDLIDFDYGPGNTYWHTEQDTLDKLSARSFEVVGRVVLESIRVLEQRSGRR